MCGVRFSSRNALKYYVLGVSKGVVSPLTQIRQLEVVIQAVLRKQSPEDLAPVSQKIITELKRDLIDARLDIRDAEYADTAEEYRRFVKQAKERLDKVIKAILAASQYDIFGAVEVAEITAELQQLGEQL